MKEENSKRGSRFFPWILILAAGAAAYANAFGGAFQFDDFSSIVDNPHIRALDPAHLWRAFGMRIFGYLTFAVNYRLGGLETFGYHLANIAIHLASSCVLYALSLALLGRAREIGASPLSGPGSKATALTAALLFAVHPANTQAVTYIVQRLASLTALLYLSSLFFYAAARIRMINGSGNALAPACAAIIAAALALFTKQNAFTLPAAVLMVELMFFQSYDDARLTRRLPLFAAVTAVLAAFPIAAFIATGSSLDEISEFTRETSLLSRKEYFLTQLTVIATYLRLIFLPLWQRLDYAVIVNKEFFESAAFLSSFLHVGMLAAAALCARRRRAVSFGILFFYLAMLIESGFIPIRDLCVEHRLYLPSAGIFIAASALAWEARERMRIPKRAMWAAIGVIAIALGILTHMRNEVWKSPEALWEESLRYNPKNWRASYNLGRELEIGGKLGEAAKLYSLSASMKPSPWTYNNLGNVLLRLNRDDEAIAAYEKALVRNYGHAPTHANLGVALEKRKDLAGARKQNMEALRFDPNLAAAHYNLARISMMEGKLAEAKEQLMKTLEIEPDHLLARLRLGSLFIMTGRRVEAKTEFEKALAIDPSNEKAKKALRESGGR